MVEAWAAARSVPLLLIAFAAELKAYLLQVGCSYMPRTGLFRVAFGKM